MTDTFGNPQAASLPSRAGTEFERSIARSTGGGETEPATGLREKINEDLGAVKGAAEDVARKATDKAAELAEQQKSYAADQIGKLASALEKVGRELQAEDAGTVADYTKHLGTSARHFADKVKGKNFGQIAGIAEDFGRRQPLAFLGMAAIAGLAVSRFMMASPVKSANSSAAIPTRPTNPRETYND